MTITPTGLDLDKCPGCQHVKHLGKDCDYIEHMTDIDGKKYPNFCACKAADTRKAAARNGKVRGWHLIPWRSVSELAEIYDYGARKYAANSWREVEDAHDEYFGALHRHLTDYMAGEDRDKESGKRHLAHALWNVIALMELTRKE